MLSRRIIPCLDVNAGRVVKGVKFQQLRDAGNPVECAKAYDAQGADELVFLDITASSDGRGIMHDVVAATAEQCFMPLTVGGGLRTLADIEAMLKSGADKVSLNTAAIKNPDLIRQSSDRFGAQCIVVAIDAKREPDATRESKPSTGAAAAREAHLQLLRVDVDVDVPRVQLQVYGADRESPWRQDAPVGERDAARQRQIAHRTTVHEQV